MLHKYETNSKRTCQVMKKVTGKLKKKKKKKKKKQNKNWISSPMKTKLIKPLYKIHKTLLKKSAIFLLLLDQNWRKNPQHWKIISKFFDISWWKNAVSETKLWQVWRSIQKSKIKQSCTILHNITQYYTIYNILQAFLTKV